MPRRLVNTGVCGFNGEGFGEIGFGGRQVSEPLICESPVCVGGGKVRVEFNRFVEVVQRFLRLALLLQEKSAIVVNEMVVGKDFDGRGERGQGLIELSGDDETLRQSHV